MDWKHLITRNSAGSPHLSNPYHPDPIAPATYFARDVFPFRRIGTLPKALRALYDTHPAAHMKNPPLIVRVTDAAWAKIPGTNFSSAYDHEEHVIFLPASAIAAIEQGDTDAAKTFTDELDEALKTHPEKSPKNGPGRA